MSTPLVILTGVDPDATAHAMIGLQWDLPQAVAVRHTIDVAAQTLARYVSDQTGLLEHVEIDLDHACTTCALREDIIPTLQRLAQEGRWSSIVVQLPTASGADQICRMIELDDGLREFMHVASVLAVVNGPTARSDLLGDDLLAERDLAGYPGDRRGVAETNTSLIEYCDTAVVVADIDPTDRNLITVLLAPGAADVVDHLELNAQAVVSAKRPHWVAESWIDPCCTHDVGLVQSGDAWTIELRSDRPFHPERLMNNLQLLGGGARRSRGCFWLPTRFGAICEWDGAGGQLSVGMCEHHTFEPHTRLLVTGIDDGREALVSLFNACLLTDHEIAQRGTLWESSTDGFEPWLGPIGQPV